MLSDAFGRVVNYLRVSVTDRCNLRCLYCRPVADFQALSHNDILSYEEYLRVIRLATPLGLAKVRLTGGEPLTRRDFPGFLERVITMAPHLDLRLTTNGTLLAGQARTLAGVGLKAVNISLDSLNPQTFERVTGRDMLGQVLRGVEESLAAGLRVKLNAVALRGINDHELPQFIDLARTLGVDVRFIEFMPIGGDTLWNESLFWPAEELLAKAARHANLTPVEQAEGSKGPARLWKIDGGPGRLGVISGLSGHYCGSCNRLRLTCDGRLRPCLYSDVEYRLRPLLRSPKIDDERLVSVIRRALARKPMGHLLLEERAKHSVCGKSMTAIGG